MRNSAIIKIIVNFILIIFLTSLLFSFLNGTSINFNNFKIFSINLKGFNYKFDEASKYLVANQKILIGNLNKINIDWVSGNIRIEEYSGDEIEFFEENSENLKENDKMRYRIENGALQIKFKKASVGFNVFNDLNKTLVIRVPVSMEDGIMELKINNVSSSINIESLVSDSVLIDSVSGDVTINNLISKTLDIETVNSDIRISAEAESLDIETVNGDINTTILSKSLKNVDVESVSADVYLNFNNCPEALDIEIVNGDLNITLPENDGFMLNYEAKIGKFKSDFEVNTIDKKLVYKNEKNIKSKLDIEIVNGNLNIIRK